jgi:hypothetical protein
VNTRAKTWGRRLALVGLFAVLAPAAVCHETVTESDSRSQIETRYERTTLWFALTPDISFAEIDHYPPETGRERTIGRKYLFGTVSTWRKSAGWRGPNCIAPPSSSQHMQ